MTGPARHLRVAPTLWIQHGTRLRLSYEVIVNNPRLNGIAPGVTSSPYGNQISRNSPPATRATASLRGVTVPVERLRLVASVDGTDLILDQGLLNPDLVFGSELGVALEACVDGPGRGDQANPPGALVQRCTRTLVDRTLCGGSTDRVSLLPATVLRCLIEPQIDTSYRLRAVDSRNTNRVGAAVFPGTSQPPLELLPNIKVISVPRALERQAGFMREECRSFDEAGGLRDCNANELRQLSLWRRCNQNPPPPGSRRGCQPSGRGTAAFLAAQGYSSAGYADITSLWSFSAADPDRGTWRENFAAGITLRRIKFVHTTNTEPNRRRYLRVNQDPSVRSDDLVELRAVITTDQGSTIINQRCVIRTDPATRDAVVDSDVCPALFRLIPNPAWLAATPSSPFEWRLVFRRSGESVPFRGDYVPGVLRQNLRYRPEAGDRLTLEFHLE